ncbi:MAG TPA: hypothetical protein VMF31_00730 [Solirubrobacterales bacterium]|nr:hypothetical protein [Solirubrobacterales bacterium]
MEETETQHQLHVLIPAELHQRVKVMAARQRRSVTAETQLALEERVERFEAGAERPVREGSEVFPEPLS